MSTSFFGLLLHKSHACFLHVSRGSAWTLPSPDFLRPRKRTQGAGEQEARGRGSITSARCEGRWGLLGAAPLAWMSQINNIFQSCLRNYTGSFFQGSSRPARSLIASASSSRPARRAACRAACGFHGDGARTEAGRGGWGQADAKWSRGT